jgi:hypothetical protein
MSRHCSWCVEMLRPGWHGHRARQIRRRAEFRHQMQPAGIGMKWGIAVRHGCFRRDAGNHRPEALCHPRVCVESPMTENILMRLPLIHRLPGLTERVALLFCAREFEQHPGPDRLRGRFLLFLLAGRPGLADAIKSETKIAAGRHAACGFFVSRAARSRQTPNNV